jgi:AraC-like DNA-binding protein
MKLDSLLRSPRFRSKSKGRVITVSCGSVRDQRGRKSFDQAGVPQPRPGDSQDGCITVPPAVPVNTLAAAETCPKQIGLEAARPIPFKTPTLAQEIAATRIAVSLDYMMAHLDKPVKISTLSALSGFSPSSFFAFFKCATGDTPLNWFIKIRMRRAGELLRESNLQIKEIARQLGYGDPFYFSRLFKSVHGMAPKKYRAQRPETSSQT